MAVTTSYQDIVEMGMATSTKNQPDEIATSAVELLNFLHRTLSGLYSVAARFAPTVFGVISSPVSFASVGWARPEDAENIYLVEKEDGTKVTILTFEERDEPLEPVRLYELGGYFRLSTGATDPDSGDNLVFYYAKSPTTPSDLSDTLDALWKESYNGLLGAELGLRLASKDGREEEIPAFTGERNRWARLFVAYLEHHTSAAISKHGTSQRHANAMLAALDTILTPGSEAILTPS